MSSRVLARGDIILLSNLPKPEENHEQKGTRPWLVLSSFRLNETSPFVIAAPFTSTITDYPFSINWRDYVFSTKTSGMLLLEQMTCLDVDNRSFRYLEHVKTLPSILQTKEKALLDID